MVTHGGRWVFMPIGDPRSEEPDKLSIGVEMEPGEWYSFALDRCNTEAKVGNWLLHLSTKEWWQRGDADDMLTLLVELHNEFYFTLKADRKDGKRCIAMWCLNDSAPGSDVCLSHMEDGI